MDDAAIFRIDVVGSVGVGIRLNALRVLSTARSIVEEALNSLLGEIDVDLGQFRKTIDATLVVHNELEGSVFGDFDENGRVLSCGVIIPGRDHVGDAQTLLALQANLLAQAVSCAFSAAGVDVTGLIPRVRLAASQESNPFRCG